MVLDVKECVLQVQNLCLRDFAVDENHLKGFAQLPDAITADLEKSHQEVESRSDCHSEVS